MAAVDRIALLTARPDVPGHKVARGEFFGNAENLSPSRLAAGWRMPHASPAA